MAKQYKQIAAQLRAQATQYPEDAPQHADKAVFTFGTLKVRCKPTSVAINAMADKFDKARDTRPPLPPQFRMPRRESAEVLNKRYAKTDPELAYQLCKLLTH